MWLESVSRGADKRKGQNTSAGAATYVGVMVGGLLCQRPGEGKTPVIPSNDMGRLYRP
ncbi:MAG: hypothetical protein JWR01_2916 [Subtercola sp.]|nr:hypothetical protein [Subtercola sp.]